MTTIKLHNTKTRTKETFVPIDDKNVRMYVCGPTVYDRAHLGNARPVVVFDVLYRLLRHVYGADHVTYVRNFTDVDDKINARALENVGSGGDVDAEIVNITNETIQWFLDDMAAVGALEPDHMPRATKYIEEMKEMIGELILKGFAYSVQTHTGHNSRARFVHADSEKLHAHGFLSVAAFEDKEIGYHYGELSGRSIDEMISGSRAEVGEGKRNPMDSVLWKPSTIDQPYWNSEWGPGRPGWHIECSAMSRKLLGKEFDIHGGGLDLLFPHHENEIAQCRACDGPNSSARYWLHNEMLQVEGKKMSKSLGNFFTVRELLEQGVPGEVIRLVFLSTHYRKPMDWTAEKAKEAKKRLIRWFRKTDGVEASATVPASVEAALADNLNTHLAISKMDRLSPASLKASMRLIGLPDAESVDWFREETILTVGVSVSGETNLTDSEKLLSEIALEWQRLRDAKLYPEADKLKTKLGELGVTLTNTGAGPQVNVVDNLRLDASKLEALK